MAEVGRPSKYDDRTPEKWRDLIEEYISSCKDKEYQLIKTEGDKSTSYENMIKVKLPMVEGLANFLRLHVDTIYEWAKDKNKVEFSDALKRIKSLQCERLVNMGLSRQYDSGVTRRLLAANHGMAEKTEHDVTTKGESFNDIKNLTDEQLLARRASLRAGIAGQGSSEA